MSKLEKKPEAFIVASAIGYYGNRDDEELTEDSPPGDGFLTETVIQWESYADSARDAGIRVVNTRNGIVLSGRRRSPGEDASSVENGRRGAFGWWKTVDVMDFFR